MEISSQKKEVLEAMGWPCSCFKPQSKVIKLCTTFVFQKDSPLTLDLLKQQEDVEKTKTMGYFLSELRKRVSLHESFDAVLRDFLRNRNNFIHDLSKVPHWDFYTAETSIEAKRFVFALIQQTEKVLKVFAGLILAWQEQAGMSEPLSPSHEWFAEVEKHTSR